MLTPAALIVCFTLVFGLVVSYTDFRQQKIFNWTTYPAAVLIIVLAFWLQQLGSLWFGCAWLLLYALFAYSGAGLGRGDVKAAFFLGTALGLQCGAVDFFQQILLLCGAIMLASVFSLALFAVTKSGARTVPHGPGMVFGSLIMQFLALIVV